VTLPEVERKIISHFGKHKRQPAVVASDTAGAAPEDGQVKEAGSP